MAHATAQNNSFFLPPSLTVFQLNAKLRAADSSIEQAARALTDARNELERLPGPDVRKFRKQLYEQREAVDCLRRNLTLFVAARRRELFSSMETK